MVAGQQYSCALASGGSVQCWGSNGFGQLGDGSTVTYSAAPVAVSDLVSGIFAISSTSYHICTLANSAVQCWGLNEFGQLGNNSTATSPTPVQVLDLSVGSLSLAAGGEHTCVITAIGEVQCWGANGYGQIGMPTTGDAGVSESEVPVNVPAVGSSAVAVIAGYYHTCAVSDAGGVRCWGDDFYGQLGNGGNLSSSVPVSVQGLSTGIVALAAGKYHTCALSALGDVSCWGYNRDGQLGTGSLTDSNTPQTAITAAKAIAAGHEHTCTILNSGAVECWGWNNRGQLGTGYLVNSSVPVQVQGLNASAKAICAGDSHTCALLATGAVMCWGDNTYGELGVDPTTTPAGYSTAPIEVTGL